MNDSRDLRLLVEIAYMYYEENAKQSEIAKKFNISRSLVSRYLTKAKEIGIVEIVIHDEFIHPHYKIEQKLKSKFKLKNVICVNSHDNREDQKKRVANAAGKYLIRQLKSDSVIAIAGGTTINEVANSLTTFTEYPEVTFVSMVGGIGEENKTIQSNFICDKLATKTKGKSMYLYAPVVVDSAEAKEVFINQSYINNVLDSARNADFALLGIAGNPQYSSVANAFRHHLRMQEDFNHLEIVGDLCYNFIDKHGKLVDCEWNKRVISLEIDQIKRIPNVIVVAEGKEKVESIVAVLNASLIDTLVTDEKTAQSVLEYPFEEK